MRLLKSPYGFLSLLVVVYGVSRLFNLTVLPIFTDESIYIYWAKLIESTHLQWFVSLTDGKPPLLIWMITIFLKILPDSWYLVAGRLPAVIAGGVSVVAIYHISLLLFEKRNIALVSASLYIVFPFTLLYDRMALFDSPLQAALLVSTYFALKTAKSLKVKDAVFMGISLGIAFLFKPTALVFVGLLAGVVLLFAIRKKKNKWFRIIGLIGIAVVISEVINNLQRVSSVYFMAGLKNAQFQQPIEELLKNPFALTYHNMNGFIGWIIGYYTVPFLLLGLIGMIVLLTKNVKVGLTLAGLWIIPIIALATIGREIFPRYMLFTTPYFLIAVAFVFVLLYEKSQRYALVIASMGIAIIVPFLVMDYAILTNPVKASLPETDYNQLIATHPSGYGLDRVYDVINQRIVEGGKVTLVTQGTFGLYPYAFMLEYWDNPNITILPRWPLDKIDDQIISSQASSSVIILLKEHDSIPENLPLRLIEKVDKPGGMYPILITELQ
ncbi:MAG TPA: glycosyltransferase family 39 protein [Candidatus Woesebacteria bacterium]|nr:glycosyltransferase family 39 protein [Candidatus Woesebacteria bacterium]